MEDTVIDSRKFKVVFEVEVEITGKEIDNVRKSNRGIMSTGFFAKDESVAMVLAYNKARESVIEQKAKHKVIPIESTNLNIGDE